MKRFNDRLADREIGKVTHSDDAIFLEAILATIGEELERIADALEEANRQAGLSAEQFDPSNTPY